jgi:predicted secreted protein
MTWSSALTIYGLFWALSVFFVLPFAARTADEAGAERIPGQAESAPHEFRPGRIILRVTIVATILWAIFQLNYHFGWLTEQMFNPFANGPANI